MPFSIRLHRLAAPFLFLLLAAPAWGQILIPDTNPNVVDFDGFKGNGFAPEPAAGQLDSDAFAVTGMSDGSLAFGGTETSGDFARGVDNDGTPTGGLYAYDDGSEQWLFVQPGGDDFTPGTITVRYRNDTGATITEVDVAYDIKVRNDQGRSNSWNFSYSLDDDTYIGVGELDYTSPEAADTEPEWITVPKTVTLDELEIATGAFFYVRFSSDDVSGSGSRDEIGFDNLSLTATTAGPASPTVSFASPNSQTVTEGTDTQVEIVVQIMNVGSEAVSVDVVLTGGSADATDFGGGDTETVTFPAGDDSPQTATFTLTNDPDDEGTETAIFELQNLVSVDPDATIGSPNTYTLTIDDDDAVLPALVINEIYANPTTGIEYDANNDGVGDSSEDEFVEIVNDSEAPVDLGGFRIEDSQGPGDNRVRHVFPEGTLLQPSQAILVFGDGSPQGNFGGALVQVSTRGGLDLVNNGETLTLFDAADEVVASYEYGNAGSSNRSSFTRNPDLTGGFVRHNTVTDALFSPGTRVDGTPFGGGDPEAIVTVLKGDPGWRMLAAPVEGLTVAELAAQNLVQGIPGQYPGADANVFTSYDGTGFVEPGDTEVVLESGHGFIWYLFDVRHDPNLPDGDSQSYRLPFTLQASGPEPENGGDVTVDLHADGEGWNLLGNPFDEAIDVDQITPNEGGSLASIVGEVWNPNDNTYELTSNNPLPNTLAIWQGAFFQNDDATSVTIPIGAKLGSGAPFYGRPGEGSERGRIGFELAGPELESGAPASFDRALVLYLDPEASDGWDLRDATKLTPLRSTYATLAFVGERAGEEVLKAQDSRPFAGDAFEVPLAFEAAGVSGAFALKWPRWVDVPDDWTVTLSDGETGAVVDLRADTMYTFTASATREAASREALALPPVQSLRRSADSRFTLAVKRGTVDSEGEVAPVAFDLGAVHPNPASGAATVRYALPEAGAVRLVVYDVLGREVATLADGPKAAGRHEAMLRTAGLASGVYIVQLRVGDFVASRRFVVVR